MLIEFVRVIRFPPLHLPIITVLCTNRLSAIDPAVKRRAAEIFQFDRPSEEQLLHLFQEFLKGINIMEDEWQMLVGICTKNDKRDYGFTYSDITQKILPSILLTSYPDKPVTFETVMNIIKNAVPTPPFSEYKNGQN
jgi:SpoVK/Ycf46/Vps4 family AAA+-type ATPase